jgi:hypothetical protein
MTDHCRPDEQFIPNNWTAEQKWRAIRSMLIGREAVVLRKSEDGKGYCLGPEGRAPGESSD